MATFCLEISPQMELTNLINYNSTKMGKEEMYMMRCFDLARLGAGAVSPNPMVGAVLVYNDRIIGEGYHQAYGQAHAEVNTLANVAENDKKYISDSTLYVSLEPCCIYGNTPPCTSLIIREKIPRVVISTLDQTPEVAGKGVQLLHEAGVQVITGVLKAEGDRISALRNTFVTEQRPYIILKYAQTSDGFFAPLTPTPFWITNAFSKRLVHKWRSEVDAILISGRTASIDNPKLTNRLFFGKSPTRIILDSNLELDKKLLVFDESENTYIFYSKEMAKPISTHKTQYIHLTPPGNLHLLLKHLYQLRISSLLIEGGARLLQSFINHNLWDEARVFVGNKQLITGIDAPRLPVRYSSRQELDDDLLLVYYR